MSIYDFTPAELEEIRRADAELERHGRPKSGRGRKPGEIPPKNREGNPVYDFRYAHGLTQARAAEIFDCTNTTVRNWETGKSRIPKRVLNYIDKEGQT